MKQIGFIGAGNMATAIIRGIYQSNSEAVLLAYDLDGAKLEQLKKYGVTPASSSNELAQQVDYLLLAVKPQHMTEVLQSVKGDIKQDTVIISIAAGITEGYISAQLGFAAKVVLAMPNTPLMLSCGATALSKSACVSEEEFGYVRAIFDSAGITEVIPTDKMNEIIPINGSSPAFIYYFAECFVNYGKSVGLDEKACLNLFSQTLIGSAKMLTESGMSIAELITMVSSKGGTTIAGLEALHESKLEQTVQAGCERCVERAYELTK